VRDFFFIPVTAARRHKSILSGRPLISGFLLEQYSEISDLHMKSRVKILPRLSEPISSKPQALSPVA
jgi:hypothetical protein